MTLDYSLHVVPTLWQSGSLPVPDMRDGRVRVSISGSTWSNIIPPYFPVGDLLCYKRPSGETAITLLLTSVMGVTPPSNSPTPLFEFKAAGGSTIFGQIRIALTPEAIGRISKSEATEFDYELALSDVHFIDKTPAN